MSEVILRNPEGVYSPRDYEILLSAYVKDPVLGVLLVACILDTQ